MVTATQQHDFADSSAKSSVNRRNHYTLSLVEKGWAGARRLSIVLVRRGVRVYHLVRGELRPEVLEVLTPYEGMQIRGVSRRWYSVITWVTLLRAQVRGELMLVLVDNEKAFGWVSRMCPSLRDRLVLVQEADDGSPRIGRCGAGVDAALLAPIV